MQRARRDCGSVVKIAKEDCESGVKMAARNCGSGVKIAGKETFRRNILWELDAFGIN